MPLTLRLFTVIAFTLLGSIGFEACGHITKVSVSEVKDDIERNVPIGSSFTKVMSFLDSYEIKGLKAEHGPLTPNNEPFRNSQSGSYQGDGLARFEDDLPGYVQAVIMNTGRDRSKFQTYRIEMWFYFDKDQRLVDYKALGLGSS